MSQTPQKTSTLDSTIPKPVFLYLKACPFSERQLRKIRDAGYLPIAVDALDSVKVIEPALLLHADPIAKAAMEALLNSGYEGALASFGRRVAKQLVEKR